MEIFETSFPDNFRHEDIQKILGFTTTGKFCQLICIPGAGKATIFRLLAHNRRLLKFHLGEREKSLRFVYYNFLDLTSFEEAQISKFLLLGLDQNSNNQSDHLILSKKLHEAVNSLATKGHTIVFLFDHFDEVQNRLPRSFFQNLKNLRSIAKYKFSAVFATRRNLRELMDEEIIRDYWDFFVENAVYLKIYNQNAIGFMFDQIENIFANKLTASQKTAIINLSGGHAKLTKIITELALGQKIELEEDILSKNGQIQAILAEIWLFLTNAEQHELFLLSKGDKTTLEMNQTLEGLINLDLLHKNQQGSLKFSIPLFERFVKNSGSNIHEKITSDRETRKIKRGQNDISELLSPQEYRLLQFLIDNVGKIITREELISAVWPQTKILEAISDEAIDQMVFRLRKKIEENPRQPQHIQTVKGRGFKFES